MLTHSKQVAKGEVLSEVSHRSKIIIFQIISEIRVSAFHTPIFYEFYERHCVTDTGKVKQLLKNTVINSRPWANLSGCKSKFSCHSSSISLPELLQWEGSTGLPFLSEQAIARKRVPSPHSLLSP